jgi:hypothetical protein
MFMSLRAIPVHRCLDKRLLIFGFEVTDLFIIALILSLLSTVLGRFSGKIFLIWFPTILVAAILRLSKRGKPENFLLHWIRFQVGPASFSAFLSPQILPERRRKYA